MLWNTITQSKFCVLLIRFVVGASRLKELKTHVSVFTVITVYNVKCIPLFPINHHNVEDAWQHTHLIILLLRHFTIFTQFNKNVQILIIFALCCGWLLILVQFGVFLCSIFTIIFYHIQYREQRKMITDCKLHES